MSQDISNILKRFNQLSEGLNQDQTKAKQLPALFKPRHISVLSIPTDPKHPMTGYAVGASESAEPEQKRLGPNENDPFEQGWKAFFRRQFDTDNPYEKGTAEYTQWLDGYREGEAQPNHYDESIGRVRGTHNILKGIAEADRNEMDTPEFQQALAGLKKKAAQGPMKTVYNPKTRKYQVVPKDDKKAEPVKEDVATEDVISKLKDKLGDYLSDISKEIKKDPDLVDKLAAKASGDQIGPPVKTIKTDDGHEISIHGNEDDGFRVSIKNKQSKAKFESLDHAVMACEMFCNRRRGDMANVPSSNNDYLDEA